MTGLVSIEVAAADIDAARRGDRAARERLYRAIAPGALRIIRRIVPQHAAEDILQDTCMALFERLGDFRGAAPFGAWARAIAVNRCLMYLRSPWHRLRDATTEASEAGPSATDTGTARLDIERLLNSLSPLPRMIVWLHEIEGYSHEEIAAAFGRSVSFSKSQLARAQRELRRSVAGAEVRGPLPVIGGITALVIVLVSVLYLPFGTGRFEIASAAGTVPKLPLADERWLEAWDSEPAVTRFGSHAAVVALEDHIALMDDLLTESHGASDSLLQVQRMQQNRAMLVDSLVRVREAQRLLAVAVAADGVATNP